MPRGKAATSGAAKKPRAQNGHKLAEQFPQGEVLQDLFKKKWILGEVIGQGGFGLIYLASKDGEKKTGAAAEYVIKIEPIQNGPLFCEVHFYQRAAKPEMVTGWLKSKKLKYLGVPPFIASGQHEYKKVNYRFMVMQRFGTDLQKLFEGAGKSFSKQTVYAVGLRMIDALEYLHENSYIHADIKASNCLLGYKNGKEDPDTIYLVDFGLATKYELDGKHKELKEDPRKAHDGTIEFTSIDAHKGIAPSRRGDMEILGYCMLQWLCEKLPWEDKLTDKNYVRDSKIKHMSDIPTFMKKCFPSGSVPDEICTYLKAVKLLKYEEKPNYNKLREILTKGLTKLGVKDTWKLALPIGGKRPRSPSPKKAPTKNKVTDGPSSAKKVTTDRSATSKAKNKLSTPKPGTSTGKVSGKTQPGPPGSSSRVPAKQTTKQTSPSKPTKPSTPVGSKIIPGLKTSKAKSAKVPGREAKSPVPGLTNGAAKRARSPATSPAPKKRKVVRKRNAHLVEMGCQTSPGLKKNK